VQLPELREGEIPGHPRQPEERDLSREAQAVYVRGEGEFRVKKETEEAQDTVEPRG